MKYTAPQELAKAGRKLWKDIAQADKYELRPDELRILEDACREADLIDELFIEAKDAPKLVRGSQGQQVINPLISEMRQHRATFASLMGKLKLPDDSAAIVPNQQRDAGSARWKPRSA